MKQIKLFLLKRDVGVGRGSRLLKLEKEMKRKLKSLLNIELGNSLKQNSMKLTIETVSGNSIFQTVVARIRQEI